MKTKIKETIPFTDDHLDNKELIIKMLNEETKIIFDDKFQKNYHNKYMKPYTSMDIDFIAIRLVLDKFGFDTTNESVVNYRKIFKRYYSDPDEYDEDVINASHYMKNNRLMFYKTKELNIDDKIPNVDLLNLDSSKTNLYDILGDNKSDYTIIASFSMS